MADLARRVEVIRLSVAIQAHPSREQYARLLRHLLRGSSIVYDPEPDGERNPWRTARECWRATPANCTHRLVVQEDILPCRDFLRHARRALAAKPDRIVSFYVGETQPGMSARMLIQGAAGSSWCPGVASSFVPALALAIPQRFCASLAGFEDGTRPVADDDVYGRWTREHSLPWWATVPSLVNHDHSAPSLMSASTHRRQAVCWVGSCDPGIIDWSAE